MAPPLAERLGLRPHPEGGWFRETWRTDPVVAAPGYEGERPSATAIYFLLPRGEESRWHQVASDELWLWHRGGPLTVFLGGRDDEPAAEPVTLALGPDVEAGEAPELLVPAGTWQSARAAASEALVTCVVSPGFDFADFRLL
ncbi:MAG: cupin domain-containing protein [Streptosporangiaceae bacterium]